MKNYQTRKLSQRVRYALIAGMAGAFLVPQVGFAAPTGGESKTANILSSSNVLGGTNIDVTSAKENNVITWRDYSIGKYERVRYDGGNKTNNYLNIVTGANSSNINGKILGGNNVYIVNPNGVIFGKDAEVNVGHLHVSTQEMSATDAAVTAFSNSGASPLNSTAALKSDVVNMGTIKADTVEVHGAHIRFLNAANVQTSAGGSSPVVNMYTAAAATSATDPNGGYAHIGYRTAAAPTNYTVHTAGVSAEYYQLVKDKTELDKINDSATTLAGKYMLENDIDLGGAEHTPIGGNTHGAFTGKFDGNFYRVKNFNVSNQDSAGLFGEVSGGRIENLGVSQATIVGKRDNNHQYAGGIVGHTSGTFILKNVYVTQTTKVEGYTGRYGGIVGSTGSASGGTDHTVIDSAYSKAVIGTDDVGGAGDVTGGGIVGTSGEQTDISNTYSAATKKDGKTPTYFAYLVDPNDKTTIKNSYGVVGEKFTSNDNSLSSNTVTNTYKIKGDQAIPIGSTTGKNAHAASTYTDWSINNTGAPGAKWRIYEGRTLPLLTAFMGVSSEATYDYRYFSAHNTPSAAAANGVKNNNGGDITAQYNSYYLKPVDKNDADKTGSKSNAKFGAGIDRSQVIEYKDSATKDFDRTNGIRNAGTKAMFWSDQDGPNLRGVNVTVTPREVKLDKGSINPKRMYNGKSDVTKAFIDALKGGNVTSSGFTKEDIDAGTVDLDFTSGNFKAWMVDKATKTQHDKNVGEDKPVKFSGTIKCTGTDAGNYTFKGDSLSNLEGSATITKAPLYLNIGKKTADDKKYDGTSAVKDNAMLQSGGTPNITLDKSIAGPTTAQVNAGQQPQDGALMSNDNDTQDTVNLTNVSDPKYTNTAGTKEQIHVGAHKLQYTGVGLTGTDAGNYELYYRNANNDKTQVTDGKVYLDGKIVPRPILSSEFKLYRTGTTDEITVQKVYDGTAKYKDKLDDGTYLSSNAPASGDTGIVARDQGHITFGLTNDGSYFKRSDGTATKNVKEADGVAYNVTGKADGAVDADGEHLYRLGDYYVQVGSEKKTLDQKFVVSGAGRITPKALTATVRKNHIEKTYDAKQNQTDGNRNDTPGDQLVELSGFVESETRKNTSKAVYATRNVNWDAATQTEKSQTVTYTAAFDKGTGVESDNYTLDQTPGTMSVTNAQTLTGSYTGTIKQRPLGLKFADAEKIYDGTADNTTHKTVKSLDDGLSGAVTTDDGTTNADGTIAAPLSLGSITSRYGKGSAASFTEDRHAADGKIVEYTGLKNALGANHNYKIEDKQYGAGKITRRLIESSGFQVRKKDGTIADATKVYDGTDKFRLADGSYLVAKTAGGSPNTGVVDRDKDNIYFTMKGQEGHFLKGSSGTTRTSHVSEAERVAYSVIANTKDGDVSPLSNYYFGNSYAEADRRNLENVKGTDPRDAVTAMGKISAATLTAQTQKITKVYDGWKKHTDGNRKEVTGDSVVSFTGWVEHDGTVERRTNSSTATYADGNVARDADGNIIEKSVTYTAKLTGEYADDYKIVDGTHESTPHGTGANTTVTLADFKTDASGGKITPRKLNITMDKVSKTYDGKAENTDTTQTKVTQFTDNIAGSKLAEILGDDNVTQARLTNRYTSMMAGDPTLSSYGRGSTDDTFAKNVNASNGTDHDVQYQKMGKAFRDEFGTNSAGNYAVDETVYGKGTINRRDISSDNFQVRDANGNVKDAEKVYDGTSKYTLKEGWHLTPAAGHGTGVIAADYGDVMFRLNKQKGAQFADSSYNPTANAFEATKTIYNVEAVGDPEKIKNYTLNGTPLESGAGKVYGGGRINRRELNLDLVQKTGIDKVYDRETTLKDGAKKWNALRDNDSAGNVTYADGATAENKLVASDGTKFNITSNYMEGAAADKNVKRSGGNIVDKDILYNISITGGDARNYSFRKGAAVTDAEAGLKLSAKGKITPKDLSGAFNEVTKTYDGTKYVDPSKVGFKTGADGVLSGDNVNLATHKESFQSENVNGDGTTRVIDGAARKNWVNYENLSLGGADAGNYMLKGTTAKGLGTIKPFELKDGSITFTKRQAEKVYDGTKDVKHGDLTGDALKNRHIASATVTVGTAPPVDILDDLELKEAQYDSKDVDGGRKTDRVTYRLSYTDRSGKGNFSLGTGVTSFTTKGDGIITKKDVTATVKSPLTKTYDATRDVVGVAKNNANQVVANASDNITLDGLVANDGTTYTTTAAYADKNAGDNKRIDYTLNFTTNGGNYNLKYNGADNAGAFSTNNNTITKRKVDVQFKNPPARTYNGSAKNDAINPFVSSADAAVLRKDKQTLVNGTDVQNLAGISSKYVQNDRVTEDPNAGKDKLVRFDNVRTAMNNALGAAASNYEFNETAYAKGTINKANIDTSKITFRTSGATKTYDGTDRVKYNGSSAPGAVKNYITEATADLGGGHTADLRGDLEIDERATKYDSPNAGTGIRVTYKFRLNNSNIEISGKNEFEMYDTGEIKRRVLNLDLAQKSGIDKIYDATKTVHNTDNRHYNAFTDHDAKGNVTYAAGTTEDTKLVRKDGNPETTVKVTAEYADKNAGAKDVNYTARIEGDAGKNYTLKYGTIEGDAETGINFAAKGTIAKRKLTLGFDRASKQYDTEANNPDQKKLMSAIADNRDARGVDTLKQDGILAADGTVNTGAFDTTNVASEYGTRSNDPANPFTPDPNVGTKDVRYTNVKSALSGANAGNYEIVDTVYGTGEITRAKIKAADFDFQIDPSKKTYDGTTNVYWKDKEGRWQEAKGKDGLDGAKKYYFGDRSTVKLANGKRVKVNPADFSLTEAAYQNKNVAGGTETWKDANRNTHRNWVNYKLHINTTNFDVEGERDTTRKGVGTITKRDLATMLPKHLIKEYDGKQTFDETNRDYVNALANENITHIVKADQGKIQLKVEGKYSDKDASAETKADAQNGVHLPTAPNGRTVDYKLTLSGDADTLANYTIDGHDTTHTVTGRAADIYKKTLTVDVERKVKDYDGTAAVKGLTAGDIIYRGLVPGEEPLTLDTEALKKVKGQYLDSAGNPDANVRRDANRKVLDKAVEYTGLNDALNDLAARDAKAKNYRVEGGSRRYTADDEKGRIDPLKINDPSNDVKMKFAMTGPSKTYDRETTVKYKGLGTKEALKNYLTDATVMVGGKARSIKDELEIDPTKTHYDDKNAGTGKTVTYGFKYKGDNFEIADFTRESDVKGEIRRKDVKVLPVDQLWKTYDSERDVYVEGDDSIFTRRGGKQGKRVTTGDSVLELEPNGIISGDVVQNDSWAEFADENAGTGKKVKYHTSFSGTDAANYRFVDVSGGEITKPLETNNNTIAKRKLNIGFDGLPNVTKAYDTDAKNDKITARITDDPNGSARKVLQRDNVHVFGDRLTQLNHTNIQSDYGEGKTDQTFRSDPNAGRKDVQYRGVGKALRNILGGYADNYEPVPENAYSDGAITKADVSRDEFDPNFTHAHKEYDGTSDVQNLDKRYDKERSFWNAHELDKSNIESLTGSYRGTSSKRGKDVGTNKIVDYTLKLSNRNFNFVGWDGVIQKEGTGDITPRELTAEHLPKQTKIYDGTKNIASVGDDLVTFRHKSGASAFIDGDKVQNRSTATYDDANVAWKNGAWKQGSGQESDKDVNYDLKLSGEDAANYKIVDKNGTEISKLQVKNNGKIMAKEIHLKSDPQTRWINEGMPKSYEGKPMGRNLGQNDVPELLPGEVLPGEIYYDSPNGRLRWGDYRIDGYYRAPKPGTRYRLPDGSWTTQSFAGGDGDAVARNYRFIQDPANATALHIGPYIPNNEYYQALTQTSKMLPDEYAYENASLDRRRHFGRDPEAEVSHTPPSINTVMDGVDITQTGIHVADETVFSLVNEVFGAR